MVCPYYTSIHGVPLLYMSLTSYVLCYGSMQCFIFTVSERKDHFPLKLEFRATAKPAGGFPGSVLRFHHRGPGWEPFLAPTEFLTTEHNTLSAKSVAKSKACSYSRDLIRTIKGFLSLNACCTFLLDPLPFLSPPAGTLPEPQSFWLLTAWGALPPSFPC